MLLLLQVFTGVLCEDAWCVQATKAQVTVVPRFDGWQAEVLQHMQKVFNPKTQPSFPRDLPDQLTAQASSPLYCWC